MTDHPTSDEQLLLASAYVDGELTADEQARAEADPAVMSLVEELRGVRRQLAVAAPPDEQRRDAAINAALSAVPPVPSIAARRRARWMAPLAAAAAAVVVVVGGVVLLRSGASDDDSGDASLQELSSTELAQDDATGGAATAVAPQEAARAETTTAAGEAAQPESAEASEGTFEASGTDEQATAAALPLVIVTEDDLRAFAAVPPAADAASSTSIRLCRTDAGFVGLAQVQGADGIVDVEVYDVAAPPERIAVDRQSCEVVLRATP